MSNEIRLRNCSKKLMEQAEQVRAFFKANTVTAGMEELLPRFFQDQELIKKLQQRNVELERSNQGYVNREANSTDILYRFRFLLQNVQKHCTGFDSETASMINQFARPKKRGKNGTKKRPGKNQARRSARPGKKIVPGKKRKGGKK